MEVADAVVEGTEEVYTVDEDVEEVVEVELELRVNVVDVDQVEVAGRVDVTNVLLEVVALLVDQAVEVDGDGDDDPSWEYTFKLVTFQ